MMHQLWLYKYYYEELDLEEFVASMCIMYCIVFKNNHSAVTVIFSTINHPSLTCDIDLDLKTAVMGDWHCRPLGDHTTLYCLWHDSPSGAGSGGAWFGTGATWPSLTTFSTDCCLLQWHPQEVSNQLEPVKDEKDPKIVEDHREAGRVTCGPVERWTTTYVTKSLIFLTLPKNSTSTYVRKCSMGLKILQWYL